MQGGTIETVADYAIQALDGTYCKIPKMYCLTNDWSQCPQLAPYPPDWCSDGQVVDGVSTFVESTDGKHCELPRTICLTNDPAGCGNVETLGLGQTCDPDNDLCGSGLRCCQTCCGTVPPNEEPIEAFTCVSDPADGSPCPLPV